MKKRRQEQQEQAQAFQGYPIGTIAFYGPTNEFASKVVVGILEGDEADVDVKAWISDISDVRFDKQIGREISEYIQFRKVKSVIATDGIIGCPHEETVDYPEGEYCPQCPFWIGKNRFTGESIH